MAFALSVLALLLGATSNAHARGAVAAKACPGHVQGVYYYRGVTRRYEKELGKKPSKSNFNASMTHSCKYVVWVAHLWANRAVKARGEYEAYLKRQAALMNNPEVAICSVFGPYCSQAKVVAWCEGKYRPNAKNGQYLGTFQMGTNERSTYGHGSTVLEQARAAYRYFVASGKDWSPWECQP